MERAKAHYCKRWQVCCRYHPGSISIRAGCLGRIWRRLPTTAASRRCSRTAAPAGYPRIMSVWGLRFGVSLNPNAEKPICDRCWRSSKIAHLAERSIARLSGGEALADEPGARALVADPRCCFSTEPVAARSRPANSATAVRELAELLRGRRVIIVCVTHDFAEYPHCATAASSRCWGNSAKGPGRDDTW